MDFETFLEPIPRYDNTKPYTQIPFQYSLHIQTIDGSLTHHEFLYQNTEDPRLLILLDMVNHLGDSGSILVYNQTFEKQRLKELAQLYPEYSEWVDSILNRIVDLQYPFIKFHYYNPIQKGKYSIKKVLPALTGISYKDLTIGNGSDATALYYKATFTDAFKEEEKRDIYNSLLSYCKLDTEGMIWILEALKRLV